MHRDGGRVPRLVRRPAGVQGGRGPVGGEQEPAGGVLDVAVDAGRRDGAAPPGGVGGAVVDEVGGDAADDVADRCRAEDRQHRVEQVPAEVDERSPAGEVPAGEPAPRVGHATGPHPGHVDVPDRPQLPGRLDQRPHVGPVAGGASGQQYRIPGPLGLGQQVRLGGGEADRLLQEHRYAAPQQPRRDRGVQVVGDGHHHQVGRAGGQVVGVRVRDGDLVGVAGAGPRDRVGVDDGGHRERRMRGEPGQPDLPSGPAEAGHRHPDGTAGRGGRGPGGHSARTSASTAAMWCICSSVPSRVRWCSQTQSEWICSTFGQRAAICSTVSSGVPVSQ